MIQIVFEANNSQITSMARYLAKEAITIYQREHDNKYIINVLSTNEMRIVTAVLIACEVLIERD